MTVVLATHEQSNVNLLRMFSGYTVWMSANGMKNLYDDAEEENKEKAAECAFFFISKNGYPSSHTKHSAARMQEIPIGRELIKRVNLCHEEFLVMVVVMLWSFDEPHFFLLSKISCKETCLFVMKSLNSASAIEERF